MLMPALPPNPPAIEQHQECRETRPQGQEILHPSNQDRAVIKRRGETRDRVESVVHPNFAATLTGIHPNSGNLQFDAPQYDKITPRNSDVNITYTGKSRRGRKENFSQLSKGEEKHSEKTTTLETDLGISTEELRTAVINQDNKKQEALRTEALRKGQENGRKEEEVHTEFENAVEMILLELNSAKAVAEDVPEGLEPSKKEKTVELIERITTNLRRNDNKLDGLTFAEAVLEELRQEIYRDEELMTWVGAEDVDNIVEKVIELTTSRKDNREKKITARRRTEKAPAKVRKTATIKPQITPTRTQIIEGYINEDECEAIEAELQGMMERVSRFEKLVYESRGYNY